ncbi:hypothetical protein FRACYDRAFT_246752 [Fragilariopsis cylindrus CCMP1102]|uniref:PARP-type domain-containing protein n=1 Tax=Fragilariopsis cylindrus CCMP1102 TaxID=635003 RepID=A0A1E7EXX0_9STRA|nr:hypothetical protein FRACYDRAFT_246752 [Fragilariopsis cylindrus CCMP1102]|eukprot:OEU10878.1 hypothetical protein FRACYDRAFT_246752 [Fragilariopsis cylindrus CCMP1102]
MTKIHLRKILPSVIRFFSSHLKATIPYSTKIRQMLFHSTSVDFQKKGDDSSNEKNSTIVNMGWDRYRVELGRKQFHYPHVFNISIDDGKKSTAVSNILSESMWSKRKNLRPYAETIMIKRTANRSHNNVLRRTRKEEIAVHHIARANILNGTTTLSYRDVQKLVKLNELGKATGKREVLENKVMSFFQCVDPNKPSKLNYREVINIRDPSYVYSDELTKKKDAVALEHEKKELKKMKKYAFNSVVADFDLLKANGEISRAEDGYSSISGAFFAAPASTGKAKCRICGDKISNGSIRVSEHVLTKWYTGNPGSWSPRQTIHHFHACCFIDTHCDSITSDNDSDELPTQDPSLSKDLTRSQLEENSFIRTRLRDTIVTKNKAMEKDQEYNQIRQGQITLSYPGDLITFEFERDPRSIHTTLERNIGIIYAESVIPAESIVPGNDKKS